MFHAPEAASCHSKCLRGGAAGTATDAAAPADITTVGSAVVYSIVVVASAAISCCGCRSHQAGVRLVKAAAGHGSDAGSHQ